MFNGLTPGGKWVLFFFIVVGLFEIVIFADAFLSLMPGVFNGDSGVFGTSVSFFNPTNVTWYFTAAGIAYFLLFIASIFLYVYYSTSDKQQINSWAFVILSVTALLINVFLLTLGWLFVGHYSSSDEPVTWDVRTFTATDVLPANLAATLNQNARQTGYLILWGLIDVLSFMGSGTIILGTFGIVFMSKRRADQVVTYKELKTGGVTKKMKDQTSLFK